MAINFTPAQSQINNGVNVAIIDDFSTGNDGFNHGQAINNSIASSGANTSTYDINQGGNRTQNIANSLQDVIRRVDNGEDVDAVNLSQFSGGNSGNSTIEADVRQAVNDLIARGVPVLIASGNNGPGSKNNLATDNAFIVGAKGRSASGPSNVSAEGRTTSFATANLTAEVAKLKDQGLSVSQIKGSLGAEPNTAPVTANALQEPVTSNAPSLTNGAPNDMATLLGKLLETIANLLTPS